MSSREDRPDALEPGQGRRAQGARARFSRERLNDLELRLRMSLWLKEMYGRPDLKGKEPRN